MLRKFLSLFRRRPVEVVIRLESRRSMYRREEVEAMLDGINELIQDGARLRPPPGEPEPERPA